MTTMTELLQKLSEQDDRILHQKLSIAELKIRMREKEIEHLKSILLDARNALYQGEDELAFTILNNYYHEQEKDEEQE